MSVEAAPQFNLEAYRTERLEQADFTMVEIGHDTLPVAYQQPVPFTGQRAYIGVESWLRGYGDSRPKMLRERHAELADGQNIFYLTQQLGGTVKREGEESWYEGAYDTETLIPDGGADEVFISNVLGDPHVASTPDAPQAVITEAARILRPNGCLIIRETITPEYTFELGRIAFVDHGLAPVDRVTPDPRTTWDELEAVFKAEPAVFEPNKASFYLFLQRIADSPAG